MFSRFATPWPQGQRPDPAFCSEDDRLAVLAAHGTGALVDDPELKRIVDLVAKLCMAPIALITVVEAERQAFLARCGLDATETPRPTSFCAHAMMMDQPLIVPDASRDARFADNPLVTGEPHIRFYAGQPLISREGAPLGALCVIDTIPRTEGLSDLQREALAVLAEAVMQRLSQQRLSDAASTSLARREEMLRRMIDSVPGIAFSADGQGRFEYFNARWEEATGCEAPEEAGQWRDHVHPDDFESSLLRWRAAVQETMPYEDRWRLRMHDGSWRWMLVRVVPVASRAGAAHWFGALVDIHEAHSESEARELLASELSHRIKNIFAVVSGLIALRARGRAEVADFASELGSAVRALGVAHDHVRPDSGRRSDSFADLLGDLLRPYDIGGGQRVSITGDALRIGHRAATPLALIFHELATNSAKYGALAQDGGHVAIAIRAPCGETNDICVDWVETGAPTAAAGALDAAAEGFGSRLMRMSIEGQLGGSFERLMTPGGITVSMRLPSTITAG